MNIQEYISTGILESYVSGDLSDFERIEVEKNMTLYPELRDELQRIEETQEKLLMEYAVRPRSELKEKILDRIEEKPAGQSVKMDTESNTRFWRLAAAASVTIAVISSWLAYTYYQRWNNTTAELATLLRQNQRIAEDYNQVNQKLDKLAGDVAIMNNPAFTRVVMTGTQAEPQALAAVYWNESTQELYLQIQEMKDLSQENQYQLWAIIDGKPVDAGVFDRVADGLIRMKDIGKGATNFAVTIEPRGGKRSPTLETMQVIGTVQKT